MPSHTAAFAHFGTKRKNVQWSWSARDDESRTVVATFWQDQFVRKDGKLVYARPGFDPDRPDTRPGFRELMENLAWAREHCEGRISVIIARAKDPNAEPRSIAECFPSKMKMRVIELDTSTGAFIAEAEGL